MTRLRTSRPGGPLGMDTSSRLSKTPRTPRTPRTSRTSGEAELEKMELPKSLKRTDNLGHQPEELGKLPSISPRQLHRQSMHRKVNKKCKSDTPKVLSPRLQAFIRGAFDKLDLDASGSLSKEEMYKVIDLLSKHHIEVTKNDIDMIFMFFDRDRNGTIFREEVVHQLDVAYENSKQERMVGLMKQQSQQFCPLPIGRKPTDIFARPKFSPRVPAGFSERMLLW